MAHQVSERVLLEPELLEFDVVSQLFELILFRQGQEGRVAGEAGLGSEGVMVDEPQDVCAIEIKLRCRNKRRNGFAHPYALHVLADSVELLHQKGIFVRRRNLESEITKQVSHGRD